jgi:probable LLM family oxidoreductase
MEQAAAGRDLTNGARPTVFEAEPTTRTNAARVEPSGFPLVLGLDTFGDHVFDEQGAPRSHAETIRSVVEQGVLADRVGVEFFGIGEHHTDDFPMPAGDVVLAAIAARTTRIRLGSAVTVLSSDDPVRVFQRYSTLNAVSGGRAEVILGRGSSIESFPLFGYDLADYERLFEEKTELFARLRAGGPVSWQGTTRAPLRDQEIVPQLEDELPVWVGVGGNPQSVVRAARYGFSLMLAIIGGPPARFAPFSGLFRQALEQFGQQPRPVGVHAPGHLAATDEQALDEFWPHWSRTLEKVSRERGFRPPTKSSFLADAGPDGALYVGSPETVARKIATNLELLDASRFDLKFGMPGLTHEQVMTTIELYGAEVIPRVRELVNNPQEQQPRGAPVSGASS